jgi:hypothetical protein
MAPMLHFPVFEANQVLASGHLNDVFAYLDEQTRLTRSNLIGIGIVCGLDIGLDTSTGVSIRLSRGCGVTSEGYLIIEPDDVSLVSYRTYTLPADIDYPPFKAADTQRQYPLWELFAAGEPKTTALTSPNGFLDDKAVLLFLELKKQDLRSCSPNNCDDKGAEVAITLRRLLVGVSDLERIIGAAQEPGEGLTAVALDAALSGKLNLPDLQVPRFDVLNSGPVTSNDVYTAFLNVFRTTKLAQATARALKALYAAFAPLLGRAYPTDPFVTFEASFAFLDSAPATTAQVRFLQYYVDLFEDLLRAYDEFRWKGVELLCACCPPEQLFPRHLMLGLLHSEKSDHAANYRHAFLASPAVGCCASDSKELLGLFSRLVEMAARFSNVPSLPNATDKSRIDPQIRITPSVLGDKALQARAIPYYYRLDGTPPLYHLWNGEKTRRKRANQNLSYRYDEYNPAAPAFAAEPLRFDIEPYNFLRIEGHLGKRYQGVLSTLLQLTSQYRLPIDVIALRTGPYDDSQPVDLTRESARFQDLETLYDSLREELLSSLAAGAMDLYDAAVSDSKLPGGTPTLPLLKRYAPNYRYPAASVGASYEAHLQGFQSTPYIDVDQRLISDPSFANEVLRVYCTLFTGVNDIPGKNFSQVVCIYYFTKLSEILPATLDGLAYSEFENKYQDLVALARYFRSDAMASVPADLKAFVPQEELIDEFDQVLFHCKLEPIKAVHDEYARRLGTLKKRQFLSTFLQQHPGIQHKAGAPLGGTFIVVYHQDAAPPLQDDRRVMINTAIFAGRFTEKAENAGRQEGDALSISRMVDLAARTDIKELALTDAIARISSNKSLAENADIHLLVGSLTGKIPMFGDYAPKRDVDDPASRVIGAAVDELADGAVIADFFLPYRVGSDLPGIEFVLPKTAPSFNATAACANADGFAAVKVTATGGTAPYDISIDSEAYQSLGDALPMTVGSHTLRIRDADGVESGEQTLVVNSPLTVGLPTFACENMQFTATFDIAGGTIPYSVNGKALANDQMSFTTGPAPSGTSVPVVVTDSRNCSAKASFSFVCPSPCVLPCAGMSLNRGFRFWMADPDPNNPYKQIKFGDVVFKVESVPGTMVDLSAAVRPVLKATAADLKVDAFPKRAKAWIGEINKIIASDPALSTGDKAAWLTLNYDPVAPGQLGMLALEWFECLTFDIQVAVQLTRASGTDVLIVHYSPAGTTIVLSDVTSTVPPFEGQRIDKCNPATPPVPLCPQQPKIELKITPTVQGKVLRLGVVASPDPGLTYLWEAQDCKPAMGNGQSFATTVSTFGQKLVTVTAFTKAGCRVTRSIQVSVLG